jgi:hypothetical protein
LVQLLPFYRKMVEAHRVLLDIAEKHIDISKEAIRAGASAKTPSILAKGGRDNEKLKTNF